MPLQLPLQSSRNSHNNGNAKGVVGRSPGFAGGVALAEIMRDSRGKRKKSESVVWADPGLEASAR